MNTLILQKQCFLWTAILIVSSCTKESTNYPAPIKTAKEPVQISEQEKPTQDKSSPDKATSEKTVANSKNSAPTAKSASPLAILEKVKNRADMRAHNEIVWQSAALGANFFKHDALQTHDSATAQIKYKSGSQLKLKEKTLIVFDKDPGLNDKSIDRVVLNTGELTGVTKNELWIFTSAGLIQIKSQKNTQPASVTLTVNKERKLKVQVEQGTADVIIKKSESEFQKINVAEKSELEFTANTDLIAVSEKNIDLKNIENLAQISTQIKKPTLAELIIDTPNENETTTESKFEVKGRLTDLGAKLLINGDLVEIQDNLTYSKTINLNSGTNIIVFQLIRSDASVKFYRKNLRSSSPQ